MPERIIALSRALTAIANQKVRAIQKATNATKILALNARIEAARAGEYGKGFTIVADEVKQISTHINEITNELTSGLNEKANELDKLGQGLIANIRGRRLTDLALNMIEIIDRNLYERSCDVRWWATDSAVVDCVGRPDQTQVDFTGKRLGVILDAYTVYLDLWVADSEGRVLTNGRPNRYKSVRGASVAKEDWFIRAMRTQSGDEFVVSDISNNTLLDNRLVATYAAAVREGADSHGKPIGVLGIFFDWEAQSQTIVDGVRLEAEEKSRSRCLLVDRNRNVIAASDKQGVLTTRIDLNLSHGNHGNYVDDQGNMIGYALTPGYETYQGLGWYGVIMQSKP